MKTRDLLACASLVIAALAAPSAIAALGPDRARTVPSVPKRVRDHRPAYMPPGPVTANPVVSAPPIPAATPIAVTDAKFALSGLQWQAKHGRARALEVSSVGSSAGVFMSPTGKYEIEIEPAFVAGRDVKVRCWGEFPSSMTLGSAGLQANGDWYGTGYVALPRPPGGTGWIEATVSGSAIAPNDTLYVAVWANKPLSWRLEQCIVEREG